MKEQNNAELGFDYERYSIYFFIIMRKKENHEIIEKRIAQLANALCDRWS